MSEFLGLSLPLTSAQVELWLAQQLDPQNPSYNISEYLEIDGPIDPEALGRAWKKAILEAQSLRARIHEQASELRQWIDDGVHHSSLFLDFSGDSKPEAAAQEWMKADVRKV